MKALARYQIILLGEQRHNGVNNLAKVVARQCRGRDSNPRSAHRESGVLTTTPPSHGATWSEDKMLPRVISTTNVPSMQAIALQQGVCTEYRLAENHTINAVFYTVIRPRHSQLRAGFSIAS